MPKPDMKSALARSILSEQKAQRVDRFELAESVLNRASQSESVEPTAEPTSAPEPAPKPKAIRDTYTMPPSDFQLIGEIRQRLMRLGIEANKSEVVRGGLRTLAAMSDDELALVIESVERLRRGRDV